MHTLPIENSVFTSDYPCEEGQYLVKYHLTDEVELISVYKVRTKGVIGRNAIEEYFCVDNGGCGFDVRQLQSKFCKVEFE